MEERKPFCKPLLVTSIVLSPLSTLILFTRAAGWHMLVMYVHEVFFGTFAFGGGIERKDNPSWQILCCRSY
jgi:hypothetical protein